MLFIDIETYSSVDIAKCGAFKYVESSDFEIILLAYAYDKGPVQLIEMAGEWGEGFPPSLRSDILDPSVTKVAHNAAFERAALSKELRADLPPEYWEDTMLLSAISGLPMSLESVGKALQLPQLKMSQGKSLIGYFCKPCKPTVSNGFRTRNMPENALDKWHTFCDYCKRDVEVTQDIYYRLKNTYTITPTERAIMALDARINERGVRVDTELASAAVDMSNQLSEVHTKELKQLTGLPNPNSVSQLKTWLRAKGIATEALDKATVTELICSTDDVTVRRVLELRRLLGKTSTKKYEAILNAACADGRIRGMMQYYGAGKTGRWTGRLVQPQNLPQNHLTDLDTVRELVRAKDIETLELLYPSVPDLLSQLIRTALVAKPGHTFLVADYSAIEARVIAYLAGEQWRMDVFAGDGRIYEASYAKAFSVPVDSVKKGSPERQKGKIMELALGYGGGINALLAFGADKLGLSEGELQELVSVWRMASPTIPGLWKNAEAAAKQALETGKRVPVYSKTHDPDRARHNEQLMHAQTGSYSPYFNNRLICTYRVAGNALRCLLSSGRELSYYGAKLVDNEICYMSLNQTTRQWERTSTWGGKLVENIVQAFARDCLAEALLRLDKAGYKTVFHVHDEIIAEMPLGSRWQDMAAIMSEPLIWAPGLLLRADGYETTYYKKD